MGERLTETLHIFVNNLRQNNQLKKKKPTSLLRNSEIIYTYV